MEHYPLSERQKRILSLVVRSYIEDGLPVGSKTLVVRYDLDFSSATARNEFSALAEWGYITQAHTSAGRIPTESGYRYFVGQLIRDFRLPLYEQKTIQHQFHQANLELEQWMRLASAVLAQRSQGAAIVTAPRSKFSRFKHIELVSTQDRLVLMVLVLNGGIVKQQMLTLATPLSQPRLSQAAEKLNQLFVGMVVEQIESKLHQLDELTTDIVQLVIDIMKRADAVTIHQMYRHGISNLLEDKSTRPAVRLLEERNRLSDVVDDFFDPGQQGIQVIIGGEGRWEELKNCTLILSRYGTGNDEDALAGEIALLGSMRMPYSRNISAVRYVSDIMSGFMNEYYADDRSSAD